MPRTILFLCPHNAAKSVIAAFICAREADARGLDLRIGTAGTEPDAEPAPPVVARLAAEGVDVSAHRPRLVTAADLANASRVVSLGCDVGDAVPATTPVEHWEVPACSDDLEASYRAIEQRVSALVEEESAKA